MNEIFTNIPEELREARQWINWVREGKQKVPKNPLTGRNASPTHHNTWGTFADACNVSDQIGFVLTEDDVYACVDYDTCVEDGVLNARVQKALKVFNSYAEYSPSGTGVHIFVKGKIPNITKRAYEDGCSIEIYSHSHYMTMTGNHVAGTPLTIRHRQDVLDKAYDKLGRKEVTKPQIARVESGLTDREVWEAATNDRGGWRLKRLFKGDLSLNNNDHSAADFEFCARLAKFTKDEEQIDRMFRKSKLYRDKWERGTFTYGQRTIQNALMAGE